jgi:hypothetical protein
VVTPQEVEEAEEVEEAGEVEVEEEEEEEADKQPEDKPFQQEDPNYWERNPPTSPEIDEMSIDS